MNNRYWNAILCAAMLLSCYERLLFWLLQGPGDKDHDRSRLVPPILVVCAVVMLCSAAFHAETRRRYPSSLARSILNRMAVVEFVASAGSFLALIMVYLRLRRATNLPEWLGQISPANNVEVVGEGFTHRWAPITGLLLTPFLLSTFAALKRQSVVEAASCRSLEPGNQRLVFVFGLMSVLSVAAFALCAAVVAVFRYTERGSPTGAPRSVRALEAREIITQLLSRHPTSPFDVATFAAALAETDAMLSLEAAHLPAEVLEADHGHVHSQVADVHWVSDGMRQGLVAKVMRVTNDARGEFIFGLDDAFLDLAIMDALLTTFTLLVLAFLYVAVQQSTKTLLLKPLDRMHDAIRRAAAALDRRGPGQERTGGSSTGIPSIPGTRRGPGDMPRIPLGEAVQRVLDLARVGTSSRNEPQRVARRRESMRFRYEESASMSVRPNIEITDSQSVAGSDAASQSPSSLTAPSLTAPVKRVREDVVGMCVADGLRLKFDVRLINGLGTLAWNPSQIRSGDFLRVVNLIAIKMRLREKLCERPALVTFAHHALGAHPALPYHCSRRAVGALHAAFLLDCASPFGDLLAHQRLALVVSALGASLGATGLTDAQLLEMRHPLALTYFMDRPQVGAARAAVLQCCAQPGADVLGLAAAPEHPVRAAGVMALVSDCIGASVPEALEQLTQELVVQQAIGQVREAGEEFERFSAMKVSAAPVHPAPSEQPAAALVDKCPDLVLRVLAALCQLFHAWGDASEFDLWEHRAVEQAAWARAKVAARRSAPGGTPGGTPAGPSESSRSLAASPYHAEARAARGRQWERSIIPFLDAVAGVAPSFARVRCKALENHSRHRSRFSSHLHPDIPHHLTKPVKIKQASPPH